MVTGNQRIEEATVRSYMALSPGDPITPARIDQSLKTLFNTGLFADVSIRQDGASLIVSVVENPIVNRVAFEGNDALDDEELRVETQLRPRVVFTRAKAQADVQRLLELYRANGRFAADIEPKIIQQDQNRVDVVFEITEGALTGIRRIAFVGNRAFSDSTLRGEIATSESAWWKILSSTDTYDPDRLAFDREQLRRFYLSEGYADFQVISAVAELTEDQQDFFITFTVEEGEQYQFGEVSVSSEIVDIDAQELQDRLRFATGDTYDASAVDKAVDAITVTLQERGYAFAEVRPRVRKNSDTNTIDLVIEVREGPRVYVERIDIIGNLRTLDRVIRREFRLAEGDAFNRTLLDDARKNLRALDFFSSVRIDEQPGSLPDRANVRVEVEEKSTGELSFGLGFSSTDSFLGDVALTERNLLGRGQFLRLRASLSGTQQQYEIRFREPKVFDRDLSAGFDLFRVETDYQSESSFDQKSTGIALQAGFPLSDNWRLAPRYRFSVDEIFNVPVTASAIIRDSEGEFANSSLGYELTYDILNDPIDPTGGFRFSFEQDFSGLGGDVRMLKSRASAVYFREVLEDVVTSFAVEGGAIYPFGGYDPRTTDRFFIGGSDFLGFERSGLGPRDTASVRRDALGANYYAVARTEVEFPLGGLSEIGFRGSVYMDAGTVFGIDQDDVIGVDPNTGQIGVLSNIEDDASLRLSVGFGLGWASPIGPIRFNFTQALVKEDYDKTEFFRFSAGTRF